MPSLRTEGSVTVLNGEVKVGDQVAYAVRNGNQADMVLGKVIGFEDRAPGYWAQDETVTRIKIRVIKRSGWRSADAITGVEKHDRVVKLNAD